MILSPMNGTKKSYYVALLSHNMSLLNIVTYIYKYTYHMHPKNSSIIHIISKGFGVTQTTTSNSSIRVLVK